MSNGAEARIEVLSQNFRARYSLGLDDPWPDWVLDRALVDYGFPHLSELPNDPPVEVPSSFDSRYLVPGRMWQRERAGHLLAHVIMHDGRRCNSCRLW